ncbi:hypothetical protein FH972_020286 [Carpinus fangiana]|uniref:Uncharacterized protein n=1 Tax=Carpinus fangiana TaxID=176857 RepID=A0A5N6RX56_9ROSI|nr:hypothetical protein FH972_020286 [Carpinus fangiana]
MASSSSTKVAAILLFIAMIVLLTSFEVGEAFKWGMDNPCYNKYYPTCLIGGESEETCVDYVRTLCSTLICIFCGHSGQVRT